MARIKLLAVAVLFLPAVAAAQNEKASSEEKIRSALKAAPEQVAAQATIVDWPTGPGAQPAVLRQGTNGWTCLPDLPVTHGPDPMCIDDQWLKFIDAVGKKEAPAIDRVGIGYMMSGLAYASNTDPFAGKETPDNEWGMDPPHIMVVVPDLKVLQGMQPSGRPRSRGSCSRAHRTRTS